MQQAPVECSSVGNSRSSAPYISSDPQRWRTHSCTWALRLSALSIHSSCLACKAFGAYTNLSQRVPALHLGRFSWEGGEQQLHSGQINAPSPAGCPCRSSVSVSLAVDMKFQVCLLHRRKSPSKSLVYFVSSWMEAQVFLFFFVFFLTFPRPPWLPCFLWRTLDCLFLRGLNLISHIC